MIKSFARVAVILGLAFILAGCSDGFERFGDRLVRAFISEEQVTRYESLIHALGESDPATLQAMLVDGFDPQFAQQAIDYFPDGEPDAILFSQVNASVNYTPDGQIKSQSIVVIVKFEGGDYQVQASYIAREEEALRIARLQIMPRFDPTEVEDGGQPDTYDPV
jgi:hypothetical protein